ncbi:hypothetical protein AcV7_005842 [Taiwanofungus camphoratus]|nr:hypothetical protein AcV7_005842 [Antrodia cinnamomea]
MRTVWPWTLSQCYHDRLRALTSPHRPHRLHCRRQHGRNMSIDLSLDRIRRLQALLRPYTRPTCHIAGTNGKGSVSALLSFIFAASSSPERPLTVGRFNSPHLVSYLDCITLNNTPVSHDVYTVSRKYVEEINTKHSIGASSFELLTCTALDIFEQARTDVVVLEVGMGGRLDATNVIPDQTVLVSALTAVDLDHQAFLGNTVDAIAREKASIARPHKPLVLGQQAHPEVEPVVRQVVGRARGDMLLAPTVTTREWSEMIDGPKPPPFCLSPGAYTPPPPQPVEARLACFDRPLRALLCLRGEHQLDNLGTALGVISALLTHPSCAAHPRLREGLTLDTISRGIKSTVWPGRMFFYELTVPAPSPQVSVSYPAPETSLPASSAERSPLQTQLLSTKKEILVLADGAHNPASASKLGAYLSSLLSAYAKTQQDRHLSLTFILAHSHSPHKSPVDTFRPLLRLPLPPRTSLRVACMQFTPPAGMPWVRCNDRLEIMAAVSELNGDAERWVQEGDDSGPHSQAQLLAALQWAAKRQSDLDSDGLVVVAGSLYLVADFFRVMAEIARTK